MRTCFLLLLLVWCNYSNAQVPSLGPVNKANFEQKFKYTVAGKETVLNENVDLFSAFYQSSHLMISILKNKKNLKFTFAVPVKELKKGSYAVINNGGGDDGQAAVYAPDVISSTSFPKSGAYNIPSLNLKPLEFVIDAVEEAKIPNVPLKMKRIKGHFSGVFATVDDGKIIGGIDTIKGEFDIACMITGQE